MNAANDKVGHVPPVMPKEPRVLGRVLLGLFLVGGLVVGLGGWSAMAQLSGAVVAPGMVVVESSVKKVQHPSGGIVGEILVKEGDEVKAGDVVLRLDQTQTKASLGIITSELNELIARRARLEAIRSSSENAVFPDGFRLVSADNEHLATESQRLLVVQRETLASQKSQLEQRVGQIGEQIKGLEQQKIAKTKELALVEAQLVRVKSLFDRQLVPALRLYELQRDQSRMNGELADIGAAIPRLNGQQTETRLKGIELEQQSRSDASKELAEVSAKISELTQKKLAAEDQLQRVDLKAPLSGYVHQLSAHTVGGVIGPGDVVMQIVPKDAALAIEVKISPGDIDQLSVDQHAILRFTAFNQRSTPEVQARIVKIAADVSQDQRTGAEYYTIRIEPDADSMKALAGKKILPGMPVEAFVQTNSRTVLSYFIKPLTDNMHKVFREQ